jgi:hypothetical protein
VKPADAWFVTVLAACWLCLAGVRYGTWAVAGADSYGYISQATLWRHGDLVVDQPIARDVTWPDADWTFAPLGYRPGQRPGTIVPVYPMGLPIVMAAFEAMAGPRAVFFVVPLLGAATVLAAAVLAERMSCPTAGAFAALLLASSPTMLFAVMWPMSDVPATAWWISTLALATGTGVASAVAAGVTAALAILTRPNLVALALPPGLFLVWRIWQSGPGRRRAIVRLVLFGFPATLACLGVAAVHTWLYGAPLRSGHGDLSRIFTWSLGSHNAAGFAIRPLDVEPALVLLAIIGAVALLRRRALTGLWAATWVCVATIGLVLGSYLFYATFPEWWYLRLLLPAFPPAAVLGGVGVVWLAERVSGLWRAAVYVVVAAVILGSGLPAAVDRGVFRLRVAEARYEAVGNFVKKELPENALLIAFQQSSSLRHYAGRLTLRFDLLAPEWLETAVATLRERGYRPYFVIEDVEVALFQERFQHASPLGRLDWPPVAALQGPTVVQIFDPGDREKWIAGERLVTRPVPP